MTSTSSASVVLARVAGSLVDELVLQGVRHFCVVPGSRSTPLAVAVAERAKQWLHPGGGPAALAAARQARRRDMIGEPNAHLWMHLDERSAAFFGLGLAKALREPVALVCTSGTAAANFLPAVVEARYGRVPLVVLTADRPHELRDCGAPQAIDQVHLFGQHVKWFFDLEEPADSAEVVRHTRAVAARAVAVARADPAGAVHLNCPYREPLAPDSATLRQVRHMNAGPALRVSVGRLAPQPGEAARLAALLAGTERGLLVCGPQDDPTFPEAALALARAAGTPVLADPLSGLRAGLGRDPLILDAYDAFLRDDSFVARHVPEVVVRFGALPTSKPLQLLIERHPGTRLLVVDGGSGWNEPVHRAAEMIHADATLVCRAVAERLHRWAEAPLDPLESDGALPALDGGGAGSDPPRGRPPRAVAWLQAWCRANQAAREALHSQLARTGEPFEGRVFAELAELLPNGATLFVGSSMPVRDLDSFFPAVDRQVRLLANRGANGIDGVVSSALGASVGSQGPLVLVIGDVSFYHDSNGLLAGRLHQLDATIVLLNNDGGGIFSFLPQAGSVERFEELFGTPHGLDFQPIAAAYGARFTRATTWSEFRVAVANGMANRGVSVVEVRTDRARNVLLHRAAWDAVRRVLAESAPAAAAS